MILKSTKLILLLLLFSPIANAQYEGEFNLLIENGSFNTKTDASFLEIGQASDENAQLTSTFILDEGKSLSIKNTGFGFKLLDKKLDRNFFYGLGVSAQFIRIKADGKNHFSDEFAKKQLPYDNYANFFFATIPTEEKYQTYLNERRSVYNDNSISYSGSYININLDLSAGYIFNSYKDYRPFIQGGIKTSIRSRQLISSFTQEFNSPVVNDLSDPLNFDNFDYIYDSNPNTSFEVPRNLPKRKDLHFVQRALYMQGGIEIEKLKVYTGITLIREAYEGNHVNNITLPYNLDVRFNLGMSLKLIAPNYYPRLSGTDLTMDEQSIKFVPRLPREKKWFEMGIFAYLNQSINFASNLKHSSTNELTFIQVEELGADQSSINRQYISTLKFKKNFIKVSSPRIRFGVYVNIKLSDMMDFQLKVDQSSNNAQMLADYKSALISEDPGNNKSLETLSIANVNFQTRFYSSAFDFNLVLNSDALFPANWLSKKRNLFLVSGLAIKNIYIEYMYLPFDSGVDTYAYEERALPLYNQLGETLSNFSSNVDKKVYYYSLDEVANTTLDDYLSIKQKSQTESKTLDEYIDNLGNQISFKSIGINIGASIYFLSNRFRADILYSAVVFRNSYSLFSRWSTFNVGLSYRLFSK